MRRPTGSSGRTRPPSADDAELRPPAAVNAQLRRPACTEAPMRPPATVEEQLRPLASVDARMRPLRSGDGFMRPSSTTAETLLQQSAGGPNRFGDLLPGHGSMAANGNYYTNMMSEGTHPVDFEDFSNPCNEQQSHEFLVTPSASSARPNRKRSKNFSEKEDEILVSAWLNVSLDPITGANQTHKSYWTRIHDYFHENLPFPSDRSQNSLMYRWLTIQDSVNKFIGCLSRITARRQSGATMQDKIDDAKAMYKSEDGQKRSFQFEDCWKQLRGQPKWIAKLDELDGKTSNKKQKKTSNSSLPTPLVTTADGHDVAAPEENTLSRPKGHKKAKAALFQSGKKASTEALENLWAKKKEFDTDKKLKKDERFKQAIALEQERVANEKLNLDLKKELELKAQEVELKNRKEEERIMRMDLSALPDDQKQYYISCRSKIMSCLLSS